MPRWYYSGDINIEHGGYYFLANTWKNWKYASVVRCQPCSDAGGPDNYFWIECLTVNRGSDERLQEAIDSCGWIDDSKLMSGHRRVCMEIEACLGYGTYDTDSSVLVKHGGGEKELRTENREGVWVADQYLRANGSLRNLVKSFRKDA